MDTATTSGQPASAQSKDPNAKIPRRGETLRVRDTIVEIVSDSGEGAQKAGQTFGAVNAKMGNGVWTVEIIPAEIKPPARSSAGASGIRVRFGSFNVTNMGDAADLVVAFNEQVLYGRIEQEAYKKGTIVLLENRWATDPSPDVRKQYADAVAHFKDLGYILYELPLDEACREFMPDPRLGKNMFVVGMLCQIYNRDVSKAEDEVSHIFRRKGPKVIAKNHELIQAGFKFAEEHVGISYEVPKWENDKPLVVMNGNHAAALGIMAAGIDLVAMYPITPATSVSHSLGALFHKSGGCLHQAEDEIAAVGFAIGASYAGKTAATVTSGPGQALKTEFIGLAVMGEVPLVIINVQRGGPSTGLPTKVEQGDLLSTIYGHQGDAPKIVLAASTIEECFQFVVMARKLAETFRGPVFVLTDTNLASGVQPFPRPEATEDWLAPPIDQSDWDPEIKPYDWDVVTGLSPRPIPGQKGGEYVLTGLAHTDRSKVAYDPYSNQIGCERRSRKLAALQKTLKPPKINGDPTGDLLVVGWGSTLGSIDEAVERARQQGKKVSSVHLRFLSPLEPGLKKIFEGFKEVLTVEINYSDPVDIDTGDEPRRLAQLAWMLRAHTLLPIECWSNVHGQPIRPGLIYDEIMRRLAAANGGK